MGVPRLFRSPFAISAWGVAVLGLTRLAFNVFLSRSRSVETTALANTILSGSMLLGLVVALPATSIAGRFVPAARGRGQSEQARSLASWVGYGTVAAAGVVCLVAWPVDGWWRSSGRGERGVVLAVALLAAGWALYSSAKSLLYAFDEIRAYGVLETIAGATFLALLPALWWAAHGPWVLLPLAGYYAGFVAASTWVLRRLLEPPAKALRHRWPPGFVREAAGYVGYASAGTYASMALGHLCVAALAWRSDATDVAHFAVLNAVFEPLNLVPRVVGMVALPRIAYLYGSGAPVAIRRFVRKYSRVILVYALAIGAIAVAAREPVLSALFATVRDEDHRIFSWLLAARLILIASSVHVTFLSATRWVRVPNGLSIVALMLVALTYVAWPPIWTAANAAVILCGTSILRGLLPLVIAERLTRSSGAATSERHA